MCAVALALLMDVSGSMETDEYEMQRDATARAISSAEIVDVIQQTGPVAVLVVEWGDEVTTTVPWTVVRDRASAEELARRLQATTRTSSGGTYLGQALEHTLGALDEAPCTAEREVVDVSSDGSARDAYWAAVDAMQRRGVTINALVLPNPIEPSLGQWYRTEVLTNGGFAIDVMRWEDYERSMRRKLVMELAGLDYSTWTRPAWEVETAERLLAGQSARKLDFLDWPRGR